MNNKFLIGIIGAIFGIIATLVIGFIIIDSDILDDLDDFFSSKKQKVTTKVEYKTIDKNKTANKNKTSGLKLFGPKVNITKNVTKSIQFQNFDNGLVSMKIPRGWVVGTAKTDYIHYTFMAYDPKNPDYKIFFNMKTEGYVKTQKMKSIFTRYYPVDL